MKCHICGGTVELLKEYEKFERITSDCKKWKKGGRLGTCTNCDNIVKIIDNKLRTEVSSIYDNYDIYLQSGGEDQKIRDIKKGKLIGRSQKLSSLVIEYKGNLKDKKRMLDIGCGNGKLLAAMKECTNWDLYGWEINEKHKVSIENIIGQNHFRTGKLVDLQDKFDIISLVHCLEHIESPLSYLIELKRLMNEDGIIVVQVPNIKTSIYDVLIADHYTHYTEETLKNLIEDAGYEILELRSEWIKKEISLIAQCQKEDKIERSRKQIKENKIIIEKRIKHLINTIRSMNTMQYEYYIFGSSIAATWLGNESNNKLKGFLDEDSSRVGGKLLKKPIKHPSELKENDQVIMPFDQELNRVIIDKYKYTGACFKEL